MSLREHLKANLLDGHEGGTLSGPASALLDQIAEEVVHYLIGGDERLERALLDYFGAEVVSAGSSETEGED